MDTNIDEGPKLEPLPQRNGNKNQADNGNDTKPFNQNLQHQGQNQQKRGFGGPRRNNDQRGPHQRNQREGGRNNEEYLIFSKLKALSGPKYELPTIEQKEIKFSGRNRLYIGNLTGDVTDEELTELFKPYGEISEVFVNKEKNFAFLKMDYHANAEKAKRELDGSIRKGRQLRIRFAPNATRVKVKNLNNFVSNELLYMSFEIFGPVERAIHITDDRGKPTGEGIVEFARKNSASLAIKFCTEQNYCLTSVAEVDSFEYECGTKWKEFYELYKQKEEALKRWMEVEVEKLEAQMQSVHFEHETEMLRKQLQQREMDLERKKSELEKKMQYAEEQKMRVEQNSRRQQEDIMQRMNRQEEELRRRQQENALFRQAQQLNSLLDQQEHNQGGNGGNMHQGGQGANRKYNDQGNNNYNRRTYDMMNQNSGNQIKHYYGPFPPGYYPTGNVYMWQRMHRIKHYGYRGKLEFRISF
uniref:CSON007372 protein n=1 Tax=Culicoides sonorensis TaxID=179676 RepID=A0A336LJK0_CULSO